MNNYILQNENAIFYECGYSCDNAIYLKLGNESFFITDGRYEIDAKLNVNNCEVFITNDLVKLTRKLIKKSTIKKLYFDPNDFTLASFLQLTKNTKIKFIKQPYFSKVKRIVKTDDEINLLKMASSLGRTGFKEFALYLSKNGLKKSEQFLQFKAKEFMGKSGRFDLSFDPIVAFDKSSAKPHALPTSLKLKNNSVVLVDAGIKYKRYCSDRTCTSVFNDDIIFKREQKFKTKKQQKIYDIVLDAQQTAIKKARVGMKASKIDKIARDIIEKSGYGKQFVHSTGHGVGLDIHEYPNISSRSDVIIEENMVFTVEPGIYLENDFGVRIEDTVAMQNGKAIII